jgi:signal transduction histidine kinase
MPTFVKPVLLAVQPGNVRTTNASEPAVPVAVRGDSTARLRSTPDNDFVRFAGALATFHEQRSKLAREIERSFALARKSRALSSTLASRAPEQADLGDKASAKRSPRTESANSNGAGNQDTARLAHEFNNLLGVINAYAELLSQTSLDESQKQDVREIMNVAARAAALMRQSLNAGALQVGIRHELDLNAIVAEAKTTLTPLVGARIVFTIALDPKLNPVIGNRDQIHQVLLNLIMNARDAMPDGGKLAVETTNRVLESSRNPHAPRGRYAVIVVRDSGCGMDEATQARIYDPYFTTKASKGTGLGLANVRAIVDEYGGFIRVASRVGLGTTFEIGLPALSK